MDADLARIYRVPTFRLSEAVKRNRELFPEDFMFQLTRADVAALTSQFAISKKVALKQVRAIGVKRRIER